MLQLAAPLLQRSVRKNNSAAVQAVLQECVHSMSQGQLLVNDLMRQCAQARAHSCFELLLCLKPHSVGAVHTQWHLHIRSAVETGNPRVLARLCAVLQQGHAVSPGTPAAKACVQQLVAVCAWCSPPAAAACLAAASSIGVQARQVRTLLSRRAALVCCAMLMPPPLRSLREAVQLLRGVDALAPVVHAAQCCNTRRRRDMVLCRTARRQ